MRRPWLILAAVAAAAGVAVLAWPREAAAPMDDPHVPPEASGDDTKDAWGAPSIASPTTPPSGRADAGSPGAAQGPPEARAPSMSTEDEEASGSRRTTRRRRRILDHMRIEPLGTSDTLLTPEDVAEVFQQARSELHACMREHDIPRSEFRASRMEDRTLTFEVDAQGKVRPGSFAADPPLPEGLAECHATGFGAATSPSGAGGDGARIEVDMPAIPSRREAEDGPRGPRPPGP